MDLLYLPSLDGSGFAAPIWEMVCAADGEFVPPLSHRESTTQTDLLSDCKNILPYSYFDQLKKQELLVAVEGTQVLGFMSFRRGLEEMKECSVYVSTVIVKKECRGRGLTEAMYKRLFETEKGWIVTRTWSLNAAHIHVLEKLGFSLLQRIKNHRGAGIDTVYYGKESK